MRLLPRLLAITVALAASTLAIAQVFVPGAAVGGVAITPDGLLQMGRTTAIVPRKPAADRTLTYISLPRALDQWKAAKDTHTDPPAEVRTLKGLTRLQKLFVYPPADGTPGDLVLAGTAEPLNDANPLQPLGRISNRPALQIEDAITALRLLEVTTDRPAPRRDFFGCSIDPPAGNKGTFDALLKKYGSVPGARETLVSELKKQIGPQNIRLLGVPEDSRIAFVMLAADYRLKRLSMGLDPSPPGVGTAMGTEAALARLWFEPAYDPLRVSPDGMAYELRGPRLKVLAGAQVFQPGGEGPAQRRFAENLSAKMNDAAARSEAIADLQNVTDLLLLATLIRQDGLLKKAGLDLAWLADATKYPVATVPVAKTADTIVHIAGNTIAAGGVSLSYRALAAVDRAPADAPPAKPAAAETDAAPAIAAKRPTDTWFVAVPMSSATTFTPSNP
jgi:hypothetical protein